MSGQSDIILATLNARYAHASLGLRSLLANLREPLQARAALREFTIKEAPEQICATLLSSNPRIIGLGVYIWNVARTTELVRLLKQTRPDIQVVLGGPEVSHETHLQPICAAADYVICGEGEVAFDALCAAVLEGRAPEQKVIAGDLPEMARLALPYRLYTDEDLRHRVVYVEASRGCPFKCEFCLSSLDKSVRDVPLDRFLAEMEALLARGARQFKFIDRTFNLKPQTSSAILKFFLDRYEPGLFVHFELVPDRLPEPVRELVARFPPGAIQFEVGIQTFNEEVGRRISRRQDNAKVEENFRFLRERTGVHVHADLIVGLPGEDLDSFARGFDRLIALGPQEIQVGMLKRLRGTPIVRHDLEWGMVYDPAPPYEIRETRVMDAATVARLRRFAKYWDLIHNSGNFRDSARAVLSQGLSPFAAFLALADWLYAELGRTHSLSLEALTEAMFRYLLHLGLGPDEAGPLVLGDYLRPAARQVPPFLKAWSSRTASRSARSPGPRSPKRQSRHLS